MTKQLARILSSRISFFFFFFFSTVSAKPCEVSVVDTMSAMLP